MVMEFPVELSVTRIPTAGKPVFTAFLRDITERKNAEALIFESEQFNRGIFESSPDCVKVIDTDGRIIQMNSNGLCLLEIDDANSITGRAWCDLWPEETRADIRALLDTARKDGVGRFQRFCPTAKGHPRWWDVIVAPITNTAGEVVRFVSVSRDITDQQEISEALRHSEEKLRLAVSAAKLGQWTLDLTTNVMSCTDTCKANYGRAANDSFTYEELWSRCIHLIELAFKSQ
jgi:PAS domain S-box-containing protein